MAVTSRQEAVTHEQTIASDIWTIVHNLQLNQPVVDVWIDVDSVLTRVQPHNINASDKNVVIIEFTTPQTGKAIIL